MHCNKCGTLNPEQAKFCVKCGTRATPADHPTPADAAVPVVAAMADPPDATPQAAGPASLVISSEGKWHAMDMDIEIILDGRLVGRGSVVHGFAVGVTVEVGSHALELRRPGRWGKSGRYTVSVDRPGTWLVSIPYSRVLGFYAREATVTRIPSP